MLTSWKTTALGFFSGAAVLYGAYKSGHLDQQTIVFALGLMGVGAAAKDAH